MIHFKSQQHAEISFPGIAMSYLKYLSDLTRMYVYGDVSVVCRQVCFVQFFILVLRGFVYISSSSTNY